MTTATATMALTSSTKTGTTCNQTDFASRQSTTPILATMNIILAQVSKSATVEIPLTTSAVLTVQDQAQTNAISPLTSMTDFNETIRKRKWDAMHQASLETIAVSNNQKLRGRGEILTNKGELDRPMYSPVVQLVCRRWANLPITLDSKTALSKMA